MKKGFFIISTILISLFLASKAFSAEIIGVYSPPSNNAHLSMIKLYDSAEKYIHLAIYSLTKHEIAEALISAHQRGVEVKVLLTSSRLGIRRPTMKN